MVVLEFISHKNVEFYDDLPISFEKDKKSATLMKISKYSASVASISSLTNEESNKSSQATVDDTNPPSFDTLPTTLASNSVPSKVETLSVQQLIEDCFLKVTFCYYSNLQLSRVPDKNKRASLYSDSSLGKHRAK